MKLKLLISLKALLVGITGSIFLTIILPLVILGVTIIFIQDRIDAIQTKKR